MLLLFLRKVIENKGCNFIFTKFFSSFYKLFKRKLAIKKTIFWRPCNCEDKLILFLKFLNQLLIFVNLLNGIFWDAMLPTISI